VATLTQKIDGSLEGVFATIRSTTRSRQTKAPERQHKKPAGVQRAAVHRR